MSLFRFATLPVGGVFTETRRQCNTESQTSLTGLVQPQYQVRDNLLVKVVRYTSGLVLEGVYKKLKIA